MTAPPSIVDGITRRGSVAANGIAPSEMNDAPSSQAALPFSFSGSEYRPGRSTVDRAIASGGTMPAHITAAMIWYCASPAVAEAIPAVANRYADLLSGPPRSKHIISPSTIPSATAEPPDIESRPSLSLSISHDSGLPSTMYSTPPTAALPSKG